MVSFVLYCCGVWALEDSKMNLHTEFPVVQQILTHWPQIVSFIGSTGQQQECHLVHGRVSSWSLKLCYDIEFFLFKMFLHNLL